jgi:hypothetical protein
MEAAEQTQETDTTDETDPGNVQYAYTSAHPFRLFGLFRPFYWLPKNFAVETQRLSATACWY